jgi:hypothetical protein
MIVRCIDIHIKRKTFLGELRKKKIKRNKIIFSYGGEEMTEVQKLALDKINEAMDILYCSEDEPETISAYYELKLIAQMLEKLHFIE